MPHSSAAPASKDAAIVRPDGHAVVVKLDEEQWHEHDGVLHKHAAAGDHAHAGNWHEHDGVWHSH